MHPAYRSDRPGIAPDCGMELEPGVVFAIVAAIAANNRQPYRYPMTWHLIT